MYLQQKIIDRRFERHHLQREPRRNQQRADRWQSAGGEDTSWADREQQARSQADSKFSSFSQGGGWASRSGGDSGG